MSSPPSEDELPLGPSHDSPRGRRQVNDIKHQRRTEPGRGSDASDAHWFFRAHHCITVGPASKPVFVSRTAPVLDMQQRNGFQAAVAKVLEKAQGSDVGSEASLPDLMPTRPVEGGIATTKPKRSRQQKNAEKDMLNTEFVVSDGEKESDDPEEEFAQPVQKKPRRDQREGVPPQRTKPKGKREGIQQEERLVAEQGASAAAAKAVAAPTDHAAAQYSMPREQAVSPLSQELMERLVIWLEVNWTDSPYPQFKEEAGDEAKLAAFLQPLGFQKRGTAAAVVTSSHRLSTSEARLKSGVKDNKDVERMSTKAKERSQHDPPKKTPTDNAATLRIKGIQKVNNDTQELKKTQDVLKKTQDALMEKCNVIEELKKTVEQQKQQLEQQKQREVILAQEHEKDIAAAVKKREEEIEGEQEEKKKEQQARMLLEGQENEVEDGEPKTCLEAMQVFDCPERNFCISLISQWLAPKWLLASKAAAIEECLFRFWADWKRDPDHEDGVKKVVGPRYRTRAKQLSMKMCPIALSPLTHRSPMGFLPKDSTDSQVDALIDSVEDHLMAAGEVRGQLWSGELDFSTFVCDILIEHGLVPNLKRKKYHGGDEEQVDAEDPAAGAGGTSKPATSAKPAGDTAFAAEAATAATSVAPAAATDTPVPAGAARGPPPPPPPPPESEPEAAPLAAGR